MAFLGQAFDLTGLSDALMRDRMILAGPPFLFCSPQPVAIGDEFEIAGNRWKVVSLSTRAEFIQNQYRIGDPAVLKIATNLFYLRGTSDIDCYFEAITDSGTLTIVLF